MTGNEQVERQVLELIATDRIDVPISSMSGKLKRRKPKLAKAIDLSELAGRFEGERTYARVESKDESKARGMREGIKEFGRQYPRYGTILEGMIAEKRVARETHFYFGMYEGKKITADDYMGVMKSLGFSEGMARNLYPELMDVSRKLSKARDNEERSVLIGSSDGDNGSED